MSTTITLPPGLSLQQKIAMAYMALCKPCCSGSGQGSGGGSGGGDGCCGCPGDSFPLGLTCTVSIPCIGTRTISLSFVGGTDWCAPAGDVTAWIAASYIGSYSNVSTGVGIDSPTPCGSLTPILETIPFATTEQLDVRLRCALQGSGASRRFKEWEINVVWYKRTGAAEPKRIAIYYPKINLLSCSPKVWEGSYVLSCCDTQLGEVVTGDACSYYSGCVGDTLTVDISE